MDTKSTQDEQRREPMSIVNGIVITGKVSVLSEGLFNLTNICALIVKDNLLTSIPTLIRNLVNLETLDATNNRLIYIPPEIGELSNLKDLRLSINKLKVVPVEICKLKNLRCLDLNHNPLQEPLKSVYAQRNLAKTLEYLSRLYAQRLIQRQ
ncbi:hypothetical protein ACOME3_005056 [Neoechinorhynchus agilis]